MQVLIELDPEQLSKAQRVAGQRGTDLNTLFQQWVDTLTEPSTVLPKRTDADRLAAVRKVIAMTPEERRVYHTAEIARIESERQAAQKASSEEVTAADRELTAFKQNMNREREQRGAEPLFEAE